MDTKIFNRYADNLFAVIISDEKQKRDVEK